MEPLRVIDDLHATPLTEAQRGLLAEWAAASRSLYVKPTRLQGAVIATIEKLSARPSAPPTPP